MADNTDREILLALLRSEQVINVRAENWHSIAHLAKLHRVKALLYRQLKKLGLTDQVPPNLLQELRSEYYHTANRNLRIYHELSGLFERLQAAGIESILLKGAFLADAVYGNIIVRPMGDVDVLFKKTDLAQVGEIMLEMDFTRTDYATEIIKQSHHFGYRHAKSGLSVEIHWDLIDSIFGIHVDVDALWERSRATRVVDIPVRSLSPEDQILHLCIHTAVHAFEIGLCAMCDLAETLRHEQETIDWECLRQRARQWSAARAVYVNLRLAKELLNAPMTDDWMEAVRPEDFDPYYLELAREHLFASVEGTEKALPAMPIVGEFWAEKRWSRRFDLFWKHVFISRQNLAFLYPTNPDSWHAFLYYPMRIKDLLVKYAKIALSLLVGKREMVSRAERQDQINALRSWLLSG